MLEVLVHPRKNRLVRLFTLTVTLTLLILGWLSWTAWSAYRFATRQLPTIIRMEEVRGQILLLDEVLTMSARMSAETGNPEWEARYRRIDPQLDEALKEVMRLAPALAHSQFAAQTDAANRKLVAMENRAFEFVRQGQQAGAQQLLSSEEYEAQKVVYAAGMAELSRLLESAIGSVREKHQAQVLWSVVTASISVPLLILSWWFVLRIGRWWQATLVKGNEELKRQRAQLEESTHQLDEKVSERTKQLKESELATLNMMEDAVRNREKVEQSYEDLKREVAGRKKAEAQLVQAQKMEAVGQLAGGIAHDFNNILGCIMGYAELAGMEVSNPEAVKENLQEVLKASHRAKELVLQILAFSRQQEQERKPMALQPVIKEALKLLRASLPSTIDIQADVPSKSLKVLADATQIHQIIMNLSTNAAHAMSGRGQLRLELKTVDVDEDVARMQPDLRVGRYVALSVSDTGCGMNRATLERIFEPFFTTKAPGEGTGLGLAVVHGIVKSHDGAITVYSEPEKGTTFRLYFPAHENAAAETVLDPIDSIPRGNREQVLFVDDEPALASLGKKLLEHAGYQVTIQTNSQEALAAFRAEPDRYDLVITDFTMPRLSGVDLASEFLKMRPSIPIVLATGFSGSMTSAKAQAMGIRELITKPVTARSLAECAHRALNRKGI